MEYYQTGDVLYKKTEFDSKGMKLLKSNIIKLGTGTGNAHTMNGGKLYLDRQDNMFIIADKNTVLKHQEHKQIRLPEGKYLVEIVKEYDHFLEESREVID